KADQEPHVSRIPDASGEPPVDPEPEPGPGPEPGRTDAPYTVTSVEVSDDFGVILHGPGATRPPTIREIWADRRRIRDEGEAHRRHQRALGLRKAGGGPKGPRVLATRDEFWRRAREMRREKGARRWAQASLAKKAEWLFCSEGTLEERVKTFGWPPEF